MAEASDNWLLSERLRILIEKITAASDEEERARLWLDADALLRDADAEEDADLALPVWERDLDAVRGLVEAWQSDPGKLPDWDKAVSKRAFKAFKKRLKLMRLDDASTAGRNPLSQGRESSILGIKAPAQYPPEVWQLLVRQGKLRDGAAGLFELATI